MLRIAFRKVGKKHQKNYSIVVRDSKKSATSGRFVERLGDLNPYTKKANFLRDRIEYWLKQGAKPSASVYNLFVKYGLIKGQKIAIGSQKPAEPAPKSQPEEKPKPNTEAPQDKTAGEPKPEQKV